MSQTKAQLLDTLVASLLPASDSAVDIGSNAVRFANIYVDTLYGNGANLTGINTDLVSDTSPQLGGDLYSNGRHIRMDNQKYVFFGTDGFGIAGYSSNQVYFEGNSTGQTLYIRPKLNQESIKAIPNGQFFYIILVLKN